MLEEQLYELSLLAFVTKSLIIFAGICVCVASFIKIYEVLRDHESE